MDKIEEYKLQVYNIELHKIGGKKNEILLLFFQMSDIVLHYTTGQMDRFHSQVKKLKQQDSTVLDPSEP